jgi:LuxR family maltose regulon positive regulatory protein
LTTVLSTRNDLGAPPPPIVAGRLFALYCRLLRLSGSPEKAQRALNRSTWYSSMPTFEGAATALTLGEHDLARKLLDGLHGQPDASEPGATVDRLLLESWLADTEGSVDGARTHLAAAMAVAETHSLVEAFVRAGPTILRLVSEQTDTHFSDRDQVLRRAREATLPTPGADLVDPLTDRELEILSYLPSRFTNTELADHFYVSVNTIKTHMAHIYRKLDVANRNGAIARSRELGIL